MSELLKIAGNGQWSLKKGINSVGSAVNGTPDDSIFKEDTRDSKGHCNNCGSKACDGQDCKVDHAKVAVETNNKKNEGFKNKIKIAGNGQWSLKKS